MSKSSEVLWKLMESALTLHSEYNRAWGITCFEVGPTCLRWLLWLESEVVCLIQPSKWKCLFTSLWSVCLFLMFCVPAFPLVFSFICHPLPRGILRTMLSSIWSTSKRETRQNMAPLDPLEGDVVMHSTECS